MKQCIFLHFKIGIIYLYTLAFNGDYQWHFKIIQILLQDTVNKISPVTVGLIPLNPNSFCKKCKRNVIKAGEDSLLSTLKILFI